MNKEKTLNPFYFHMMSFWFAVRDRKNPPEEKIEAAEIKGGETILDYGCGPGGFTLAASKNAEMVYAADINPMALKSVEKRASKKKIANIKTILTEKETGIPKESVDTVLLFDIIHKFSDMESFLREFQAILKPDGKIAVDDHHMTEQEIIKKMSSGQFCHCKTNGSVVLFKRRES